MPFQLDTQVLKSFMAVAETGSFSQAADVVGRTQSAVSLQIKRLEESLGCRLFNREGKVALTDKGELFLNYAQRISHLQWEAFSRINEPDVSGQISLGMPEDFATTYLPQILGSFSMQHPRVQLHVRCDLTLNLLKSFRKNEFDIVLVKRDPEQVTGGTRVWREPLVWAAHTHYDIKPVIPLVLSPQPCIYRARALAALDRARKAWTVSYVSPSLAGQLAAVKAGLGITVLPANMLPEGIVAIRGKQKLPRLADSEIALMKKDGLSPAATSLANYITSSLEGRAAI